MFELHPVLAADSWYLGDFPLSALLLSRDANYPWFILVPRVAGVEEIYQLDEEQRTQLLEESCLLAEVLQQVFQADKLNIAALGNVVPQLHLHHIVRYHDDAAWPRPVWGVVDSIEYSEFALSQAIELVLGALSGQGFRVVEGAVPG
jgi:diadenosine tetraphosphate (Ap4A) HIT family hydrolase